MMPLPVAYFRAISNGIQGDGLCCLLSLAPGAGAWAELALMHAATDKNTNRTQAEARINVDLTIVLAKYIKRFSQQASYIEMARNALRTDGHRVDSLRKA